MRNILCLMCLILGMFTHPIHAQNDTIPAPDSLDMQEASLDSLTDSVSTIAVADTTLTATTDSLETVDSTGIEAAAAVDSLIMIPAADWEALQQKSKTNRLVWMIGLPLLLLLGIITAMLHNGKMNLIYQNMMENLVRTRKELEVEAITIDQKLILLLDQHVQSMNINANLGMLMTTEEGQPPVVDHELPLKVADEIVRMEKNLSRMDDSIKGIKQLAKAVDRIKSNFVSNGYEVVDMVGKPYKEGMKVSANFIPDETLPAGQRIISRVIKPQVNFKGQMIQAAQIEVAVGEE